MTEDAKIRFLFKKIQHSKLDSTIKAMKAKMTTEITGIVSYITVADHIFYNFSQLL